MPKFNFRKENAMRKIVFVALLSGLLGSALADDLLARASGGALSENSLGVKKLSQAEMAEVKGGYYLWQSPKYGSGSAYSHTYNYLSKPYKNNYNANKNPTSKQAIYSNGFMKYYRYRY